MQRRDDLFVSSRMMGKRTNSLPFIVNGTVSKFRHKCSETRKSIERSRTPRKSSPAIDNRIVTFTKRDPFKPSRRNWQCCFIMNNERRRTLAKFSPATDNRIVTFAKRDPLFQHELFDDAPLLKTAYLKMKKNKFVWY